MEPVVFLDRDDTLIDNSGDLGDPERVQLLPGVPEGLRRLKEAGYRLVVVTNQGGVARGRYAEKDVDAMHARIARLVDERSGGNRLIDRFYYCPFHPEATVAEYRREHPWRKPQPGMLLQAATDLSLDLDRGWMVGDKPRDMAAGRGAGVRTVLIARDGAVEGAGADFAVADFASAVETILANGTTDAADRARRAAQRAAAALALRSNGTVARSKRDAAKPTRRKRGSRGAIEPLRRVMLELVEEVRSNRTRRGEFGPLRIAAAAVQLAALVCGFFALLELQDLAIFARWMAGAVLAQLLTIALLLFDGRA